MTAYELGRQARKDGATFHVNPYAPNYNEWIRGYQDEGKSKSQSESAEELLKGFVEALDNNYDLTSHIDKEALLSEIKYYLKKRARVIECG